MTAKEFFQSMFSEEAKVSFSRAATAVIVSAVLSWDTAYVVFAMKHYGGLPILSILPDAGTLAAQGVFMLLFYSVNKGAAMFSNNGQKG